MTVYTLDTTVQENAPRFLWRNTVLEIAGGDDFEPLVNEMTYQRNNIPVANSLELGAPIACNAVGIVGAQWSGQMISVYYDDDDTGWKLAGSWQPTEGAPFLGIFDFQTSAKWLILVSNGVVSAACVKLGMALAMQRNQYGEFSPFTKNLETSPDNQLGAHFTAKQVERIRRSAKYDYKNLKADWVRAYLKPFINEMAERSIFAAWRSTDYPREVVYGWITGMPKPTNQGTRDYMNFSIELEGPLK